MMTQVDTVYLIYQPSQQKPDVVRDANIAIDAVNRGIEVFVRKTTKENLIEAETSIDIMITTRFYVD